MDEIVIQVKEKENIIHIQFSDAGAVEEGCDECIDYTVFGKDFKEVDGGQMDYNSGEKQYNNIRDVIPDIIDFIYDEKLTFTETDLTLEDIQQ